MPEMIQPLLRSALCRVLDNNNDKGPARRKADGGAIVIFVDQN